MKHIKFWTTYENRKYVVYTMQEKEEIRNEFYNLFSARRFVRNNTNALTELHGKDVVIENIENPNI